MDAADDWYGWRWWPRARHRLVPRGGLLCRRVGAGRRDRAGAAGPTGVYRAADPTRRARRRPAAESSCGARCGRIEHLRCWIRLRSSGARPSLDDVVVGAGRAPGAAAAVVPPAAGLPVALATSGLVVGYGRVFLGVGAVGLLVAVDRIVTTGQGTFHYVAEFGWPNHFETAEHSGMVRGGRARCRRAGAGGARPSRPARRVRATDDARTRGRVTVGRRSADAASICAACDPTRPCYGSTVDGRRRGICPRPRPSTSARMSTTSRHQRRRRGITPGSTRP